MSIDSLCESLRCLVTNNLLDDRWIDIVDCHLCDAGVSCLVSGVLHSQGLEDICLQFSIPIVCKPAALVGGDYPL